ncbi:hypothetical protein [Ornithinimicrobium sp. INDO-MA30-4]|uniref:hypothetical protein n=1 Tax=Ornithinimicrobium sp. INDO-MA30-4 TaxID=2908651 RepID=UPI001F1F1413|nr:hypothetical protein [Ornithinimicrobium sp. INDO-MA30-4]UJH70137.1 hypothetical protein L0A91_13185 [Ornithinimicrobium sp. INDO-MA30-4]
MPSSPADIDSALRLANSLSGLGPQIGISSWPVLSALATIASIDLSAARVIEPHLDALAILHQAGSTSQPPRGADAPGTWGFTPLAPWDAGHGIWTGC